MMPVWEKNSLSRQNESKKCFECLAVSQNGVCVCVCVDFYAHAFTVPMIVPAETFHQRKWIICVFVEAVSIKEHAEINATIYSSIGMTRRLRNE